MAAVDLRHDVGARKELPRVQASLSNTSDRPNVVMRTVCGHHHSNSMHTCCVGPGKLSCSLFSSSSSVGLRASSPSSSSSSLATTTNDPLWLSSCTSLSSLNSQPEASRARDEIDHNVKVQDSEMESQRKGNQRMLCSGGAEKKATTYDMLQERIEQISYNHRTFEGKISNELHLRAHMAGFRDHETSMIPRNPFFRQCKRTRPVARKSLQTLFDRAAQTHKSKRASSASSLKAVQNLDARIKREEIADIRNARHSKQETSRPIYGQIAPETPSNPDSSVLTPSYGLGSIQQDPIFEFERNVLSSKDKISINTGAKRFVGVPFSCLMKTHRGQNLKSKEVKAILFRLADDIAKMHSEGIIHRSVNMDTSVLAISNGHGLAKLPLGTTALKLPIGVDSCYEHRKHPIELHLPPEALYCSEERTVYSREGDIWALGILIFQLLNGGKLPFDIYEMIDLEGSSVDVLQEWITNSISSSSTEDGLLRSRNSEELSEMQSRIDIVQLVRKMLRADPGQRPTAINILQEDSLSDTAELLPSDIVMPGASAISLCQNVEIFQRETEQNEDHALCSEGKSFTSNDIETNSLPVDQKTVFPYPILGQIAQEVCVKDLQGCHRTLVAIHVVYDVPGHGPMMSASPYRVISKDSQHEGVINSN